jgi:hypothetical protein
LKVKTKKGDFEFLFFTKQANGERNVFKVGMPYKGVFDTFKIR